MKRLALLSVCGLVSACTPAGDALRVSLETGEVRAETCYLVEVLDEAATNRLASIKLPRVETKRTYLIGVARAGFPATVSLRAQALIGADCETAQRPNGTSALVQATFDPHRIVSATLSLTEGDADGDGFVAEARGGGDCNDSDESISPGQREQCFGDVDHDCNGQPPCSDAACAGLPCAGVPTRLALLGTPSPIHVAQCAGPITIELQDAMGVMTSPAMGGTLALSGLPFFTNAACTGASVTQLTLVSTQNVWVRAATPQSAVITVSSPGLTGDSRPIEVVAEAPAGVQFDGPPVRVAAGGCSPEVVVALVDDAGFRAATSQPVVVSLSSDAGQPFGFFADLACTQPISSVVVLDGGASSIHFSGEKAGGFTLRGEALGLASAEQAALIDPGPAASLSISGPPQPVATGECVGPFVIEGRDLYGNVTPVQSPVISLDGGAVIYTSPTCGMEGQPVSAFGLTFSSEGQYELTASVGALMTTQLITARRRGPPGSMWRWPVSVSVMAGARGPAGGYSRYTLLLAFDSRSAIDAGLADPDLGNLRVYFSGSDGGWQEVDRLIESPDTATTQLRFASLTDLDAGAVDTRYALFSGPFDGGRGLARPSSVFLFFDDFEGGSLSQWSVRSGGWQYATDRARGDGGSLKFPTETANADRIIEAAPALAETDILFEAWWNTSDPSDTDFSQLIRLQPSVGTCYEGTLQNASGWTIARETNAVWTELGSNAGVVTANTWTKIGVGVNDRDLYLFKDGMQLGPAIQATPPALPGANVGFRKFSVGGAVWLDDVTVRRFALPEPSVSVGAPFATP